MEDSRYSATTHFQAIRLHRYEIDVHRQTRFTNILELCYLFRFPAVCVSEPHTAHVNVNRHGCTNTLKPRYLSSSSLVGHRGIYSNSRMLVPTASVDVGAGRVGLTLSFFAFPFHRLIHALTLSCHSTAHTVAPTHPVRNAKHLGASGSITLMSNL